VNYHLGDSESDMSSQDVNSRIIENEWFGEIPAELSAILEKEAMPRSLVDGELLHVKGDEAEGVYLVVSGRVRFSTFGLDGQEMLQTYYEPGNWFGEVSVLDDKARMHDAVAVGNTKLQLLPKTRFLIMLEEHPELYPYIVKMLCRKIRIVLDVYHDTVFVPLHARLAKRLLELAKIYGKNNSDGCLIDFPLPQDELCLMVHGSRQRVNKILNGWKNKGWIQIDYGKITIIDMSSLEEVFEEY